MIEFGDTDHVRKPQDTVSISAHDMSYRLRDCVEVELHRTKSQCCNKLVYAWQGQRDPRQATF